MKKAREYISVVAACDLPVMICGETGTGKEVFAQAIHNTSAIKGLSLLALVLWIAWANTSLPVPVSPHIMTGRSQAATTLMYSLAFFIFSSTAMISAIVKKAVFRLTSFPEPVSYTHLDVYKRQDQLPRHRIRRHPHSHRIQSSRRPQGNQIRCV